MEPLVDQATHAKLIWITPDTEKQIAFMARVSNPENQTNEEYTKLVKYLIKHKHWSPFEMANAVFEIETTRDIARQILRHRSFSFQEYSQRYAEVTDFSTREARLQDTKNRQNSFHVEDEKLQKAWEQMQVDVIQICSSHYHNALRLGIAKEQARSVLPEGLTMSKMYMNGTIRSWLHYLELRTGPETQKEHREVAEQIKQQLSQHIPNIMGALNAS